MSTPKDLLQKDLTFEESRFQQLHLAHQANILVYARVDVREKDAGRTKELARKLRPEFGHLYLASNLQECFKLMRKHDLDETSNALDVVVLDMDANSMRLLEMINKRPKLKETSQLALISTVVILPEAGPASLDWQQNLDAVGGATMVLDHNVSSKKLMGTILDALTRKKSVEIAFRDLKATKIKATKYPFVPLFSSKSANIGKDGDDDDDDESHNEFNESSTSTKVHVPGVTIGRTNPGGSTASLTDLDDWTDATSMLPGFVATNRTVIGEVTKTMLGVNTDEGAATTGTVGIRERVIADKNIVRFIQAGGALKDLELEAQLAASQKDTTNSQVERIEDDGDNDNDGNTVMSGMTGLGGGEDDNSVARRYGQDTVNDGFDTHRSGDEKSVGNKDEGGSVCATSSPPMSPPSSPAKPIRGARTSMLIKSPDMDRRSRGGAALVMREKPLELTMLLDPRKRPTWSGPAKHGTRLLSLDDMEDGSVAAGDASRASKQTQSHSVDNRPSMNGGVDSVDLYPFIKRDRDTSGVVHSVGGLNKALAAEQWRIIHLSRYEDVGTGSASLEGQLGEGSTSLMNEKIASFLNRSDAKRDENRLKVENALDGEGSTGDVVGTPRVGRDNMSVLSGPSLELEVATKGRRPGVDLVLVTQAMKTLKRMARDTAPDVQLNSLLPIVLASGKVSIGDKDILEAGLKLEEEGNNQAAINMYKRAGLHTTKPHLSKMFLAFIHFQMGMFMQALDDLTWAIESQDKVQHLSIYSKEDHFIAFFNRSLVYFRLGNDDKGLTDIKTAISLNNDHIKAKEVLALALRRVTKYGESIEICKQNVLARKEIEQQEREEQLEQEIKEVARVKEKKRRMKLAKRRPSSLQEGSLISSTSKSSAYNTHEPSYHSSSASVISEFDDKLREVHCPIEDKGGMGTLKSRKLQRQRQLAELEREGSALPGEALKTFKLTNGFQEDLYEGIFTRPSNLQDAMMVHPGLRTPEQLDVIACTLKLFPFLWRCSESTILELSRVVEYRALQNRSNLYTQNNRADGVCFLLRGSIQGKLEGFESAATSNQKIVSEIAPYDAIGHIDLLFESSRSQACKELLSSISAARRLKEAQINGAAVDFDVKDTASLVDFNNIAADDDEKGDEAEAEEKEEEEEEEEEVEEELNMESLPRCVQNKMFITYSMTSMCEILICKREDFDRLLYQDAYEELKKRLAIVEGCRVFSEWAREEKIRLARMGQVQVFRSGDLILKQGVKPLYCSLIMKGMCKSYKSPNKSTVLGAKLADAEARAARHDLKYTYHHKLRDSLSKGALIPHPKASEKHKQILASRTHVTVSEALRYSLGIEIKIIKKDLQKAIEAELKQQEEEVSMDEAVESVTSKLSEISTLQWPMLFGEACMLDPENGTSRGTIVADTTLEVLSIHKSQLQTFRIRDNLLERMKYRAVTYPEDEELLMQKERKEQWEIQRQAIVKNLSQPKAEYLEPFYV